jgi:hypothetical protein
MGFLSGLRQWLRGEAVSREVDAARAEGPLERKLLEGDIGEVKSDTALAAGLGAGALLGPGTADEVYEEFERDEEAPPNSAP